MKDVLRILAGPLVWFAAFSAVYGLHGLICGHGLEGTVLGLVSLPRALLLGAFLASIGMLAALVWALHAPRFASDSAFVTFVSRTTAWVGLVATVWTLAPTAATSYCL